ncbi:hypothetical protein [Bdellovibrio reynosensis]|uniref:DUF975 family protein n=1 Tax=Bdellovibrio reynosensis TaxID=2835041 RepID=A0ABY4C689_9BACT|nr:hypothetical protein [Bdellovibrio reynosensis]UOF00219.1 hypothetical protein MNR06_10955 [Bdellovibrio reynosensis]
MNSFKQALNQFKATWKLSLAFGVLVTAFIFLVRDLPYVSAFLISLGFLIFQDVASHFITAKNFQTNFSYLKTHLPAYIITSFILLPTSVLFGSALGILQSPNNLFVTASLALGLLILGVYFYFVLSQSLRRHIETKESLAKAIDAVGLASVKQFQLYLPLSFYFGLFILIAGMTWGAGLIVALPIMFYANHFSYLESKAAGFLQR